ncbi:MAG TPA: hypothetical protein VE733_06715 [Streptosporangiaceae bacterium]|nr:hypothetical protein [Streptosporangiaceae bacterium]
MPHTSAKVTKTYRRFIAKRRLYRYRSDWNTQVGRWGSTQGA